MGENGTVKSWYRNRQPNMTRNEDKNSTDPKKPKKRPVRDRIKLLDIFDKRFERIESRIDKIERLKNCDE